MIRRIDFTRPVQYELMLGRRATAAMAECPVGYLPVGCLERHGDHLPMGLDVIKAHRVCCVAARALGGVVFPAHFYSGIHGMTADQIAHFTGEWGNLYTDATAQEHLADVVRQIGTMGLRALVLYSGHYPACQVEMVERIARGFGGGGGDGLRVIPFAEPMVLTGDHAGASETSLMLYLDRTLVDMTRIGEVNYRDHGWEGAASPEHASAARGEAEVEKILRYLEPRIAEALGGWTPPGGDGAGE